MSASSPQRLGSGFLLVTGLLLGGCATVKHTFVDQDAEQVWTAMVAVAGEPRYDDWTVVTNKVWVDEPERRIEIHRQLDRLRHEPGSTPQREQRTWNIEVRLLEADPPEAKFVARGGSMPSHVQAEASRYFDDVGDLLGGLPGASGFELRDRELLDSLGLDEGAD